VIVRIMGEGQFRVGDDAAQELNELDRQAADAVEAGDEDALRRLLKTMADKIRSGGDRLDDADLSPSDAVIPPEDLTLDEARELFADEGLIPDLPAR
jgi:chromosome condensin MukBEF complex kleisin-like MukF subunit